MFMPRTILHPTDFSEASKAAFDIAASLARDYDAKLIVAHISPLPEIAYTEGGVMEAGPALQEGLRGRLQEIRPADSGVRVEHRLVEGDAAEEILRLAKAEHCDVIVLGTHGRTGLNRVLMGSVAEEVSRHAECPVLTVREPKK